MASCSLPYIESKFRQSNPDVADKLNNQHIKIVQDAVDSNLFRFKNRQLLFSQEGTKKLERQRDYVSNINQQYGVDVLKDVDGVLSVNVLGLAPSTNVSQVKKGIDFVFKPADAQYQLPQDRELEEYVASEKTIRDLAARMSDRIGIPVRFESDRTKKYKGKLDKGTVDEYGYNHEQTVAVINLAYATLDTPIHEILGHPIIRAIKNKQLHKPQINTDVDTFFNLDGSEFVYEKRTNEYFKDGKDITKEEFEKAVEKVNNLNQQTSQLYQNLLKELEYGKGKEVFDRIKRDYVTKHPNQFELDDNWENQGEAYGLENKPSIEEINRRKEKAKYTLEEQQEEAIVELLGLYTADRLDKVKDGKLISLLKRLLKEMKAFMKQLLGQKEVEIDKLPDNMTLGDIANLLAYSNSKLILPGNEVIYTTPDNQKFKTYAEASKHISELAKSVENVDLDNVNINTEKGYEVVNTKTFERKEFTNKQEAEIYKNTNEDLIILEYDKDPNISDFVDKNKEYEQSKEIVEEWKRVNNIQYNPEEVYSRGQEFVSVVGAYSDFDVNLMIQNLLQHIEDNQKAGGEFIISAFTKPVDRKINHLEGGGGKIKFKIYPQSKDIKWAANADVYSGSVWDAPKKVNKDKKSELLGVSYTKYPSLNNVNAIQPNLASIVDNLAHHHNELGITLTGNNFRLEYDEDIPYSTKKIIDSINSILDQKYGKLVKPKITTAQSLTYWVGEQEPATGEYYILKSFNSIEEAQNYINQLSEKTGLPADYWQINQQQQGIPPTQTNETLKESIDSVKDRIQTEDYDINSIENIILDAIKDGASFEDWYKNIDNIILKEYQESKEYYKNLFNNLKNRNKEYTEQALINLKIAKLKEVAKKYPRSLIRSEVRPLKTHKPLFKEEMPLQKLPTSSLYQAILNTGVSPEEATRLYNQTKTPEFKNWFGNSVVKDENGEPLLVYHGTKSKEDFDTFKAGSSTGMFFTDDKQYAADVRGGRVVGPFFLRIEKPIEVEEELDNEVVFENKDKGDGIVGVDYGQGLTSEGKTFVVYDPNQIKSLNNTGQFSESPNIYYQVDDAVGTQELVDDLNEKYADNAGIIFDEYVNLVRNQIKNISGVWLKASKDGYYIEQEKHPIGTSREALTEVLNKLSDKFGIQWRWDTSMKAKGRFEKGVVYINPNKATMDTAFHEFAHPFLLVLKQENRPLYNRLVREIQKESKILERTKRLYPNLSGEELLEEAIVQSIGLEAEKKVYQGLVNRFIEWIKSLVNSLVGIQGSALSDVANMLTNKEYRRGLEVNTKDVYYQIDEADINIYKNQIAKGNSIQKEIAERMLSINREIKLSEDGSSYILANVSKPLVRVTDELKKFDFYNYNKETSEENKRIALERGNAVDAIMRDVLLEQELSDTSVLGEDISRAIYEDFKEIKDAYPDAILLPQITFYNTSKGIAGTADVVAIHKDGQVEILDVKTSKYDFYTKSKSYPGKKYADSYDMHDAQLTMYKALAETMGFKTLDKGGLKVIPVKWTIVDDQVEGYTRPQMFIEHGGVEKLYEIYNEAFEESQFKDIMGNLKKILQAKIMKVKKEGKGGQASVLESILEDIKTAIDVEGVTKFVNEAFNTFYGTDKFPGYYNIYKSYLDKVGLEEDPMDMLAKIHEIEQMVELYKDSIDSLWQSYLKFKGLNPLDDFQDDSTLSKIDKLRRLFDDMEKGFQERIPRVVASVLAKQVSPEVVEAIKTNIKSKQRAKFEKKDTSEMGFFAKTIYNFKKGQSEKTARKLKELEDQFLNDKGEVDVEEAIYREIRFGGYKDVGIADRWFSPGVSMPNTFLPTFILTVKRAFEEVRVRNIRFIPKAYEAFNKFAQATGIDKDNPHKFNEGLYTTRTVYREGEKKNVLVMSSSIDYSSYNSAKNEIWQSTEETKEGWNKRNKWMVENTQVRPSQHIEGVTKIGNLVLIETIEELENRKKKELGQKGFESWKKNNVKGEILWGDYRIPKLDKYKNSDFENILKDKNKKEYYTFLLSTYLESQNQLPSRKEEDKFILPFIDKSSNDRIRESSFWDTVKYKGKDMFMLMEEDMLKENVERDKTIPVLYYNSALTMDAKDVSNDLLHSILRFKMASDRYAVQNKYQPLADNLLSLVKKTAPVEEDAEGFKLLDKAAKAVGITEGIQKYVKKHGSNNTAAMLEAFIDTQIYGILRLDKKFNIGGVTVDTGKIANTLMNFASVTQIAFDPLTSLANSLNAQVQIAEEAFAGQFIDKESWLAAQAIYNTHEMDFIKDSLSPYNKSFLGTLTDVYDAMQGEYVNAYGHKVSKSAFKSKQNLGEFGYALMHKGEHRAAVIMMIALLKNKKVGDKSLYDIHKEQFEKTGNIDLDFNMQSRLHAINKRLHGVYNNFDAPELQRYAIGRLLIMYRKFLPTFLKRRFKAEGLDYELGDFTEGMYRTFYKKLFTDMKGLVDAIRNKQGDLTPYELYNIRRAFAEHAVIFITGLMAYALMHLQPDWDDDDELQRYAYSAVLYQVLRVNAELSIGFAVGDINDYFLPDFKEASSPYKTTTAAYGVLIKLTKLYSLVVGDLVSLVTGEDIARYQRDTGLFEKGDSKTVAALLKLWGISGKNLNDEMMLNTLMLTKGVEISK